ncbi:hypothetical protein UlMin_042361 [Ulmus minor]
MDAPSDDRDRALFSSGERHVKPDNLTEQPLSPKDERIVSANTSPDAVVVAPPSNATEQPESLDVGGDYSTGHQLKGYGFHEQNVSYAGGSGYGSSTGTWNGYSQYLDPNGLHVVSPVVYNDNPSLVYHSGYGFNPEIAYGQYSPVASPLPPLMVDGQLYSPQQLPFSPSYYPQSPHISSAVPVSSTELMTTDSNCIDNMIFGPGAGYFVNFGSIGGANLSGNIVSSSVTSPVAYPQPMGILGPYEHNFGQISQQQRPNHGFGLVSSPHYHHGSSYQSSSFGSASFPAVANHQNQLILDKSRRRERDQDSASISNDSHDIFNDRNRGPRASKLKGKSATEQGSLSSATKNNLSASGILLDSFNRLDFVTDYENAKFFIIKSFSEDNVHKSIKYNVWASTPHGNKKLDAAYHEARETKPSCPVFLFFSVNASGQFCGMAEMDGPVNFEKNAEYWQQDRWSGQFPVRWHFIKDVPNIRFRHILLDNNDNKPVTHSRDSQEVGLKQGIEMLKIFKDHETRTSILDDFNFYDEREKVLKDRKARQQQASSTANAADEFALSNAFAQSLTLKESSNSNEVGGSSRRDSSVSLARDSQNPLSDSLSNEVAASESGREVESGAASSV